MPTITDKLIREALEEFDKQHPISIDYPDSRNGEIFYQIEFDNRTVRAKARHELIKSFIETKLRQMAEEIKERLKISEKSYRDDNLGNAYNQGYNQAVKDLKELKKTT